MTYLLRLENISKSFKNHKVIDNLTLDVYENQITGIVGESGCGKTTLAKIIVGLIIQDFGKIIYKGMDLDYFRKQNHPSVKEIQMVFQDPLAALNPKFTVYTTLREIISLNNFNKKNLSQKVVLLLSDVGLGRDYFDKYPFELSGGQAQRVCIARSLAANPKLLILDEPLSSLDFDLQENIIQLLLSLKAEKNLTYIFITHDIYLAKRICDKIAVMKDGKVVEFGKTEQVLEQPVHQYTKQLLKDAI